MVSKLNNYTQFSLVVRGGGRFGYLLGAALLVLIVAPAQGGMPALYGEGFAQQGKQWQDVRPLFTPSSRLDEGFPAVEYQRQLEQFESSGGPYSSELAEPLLGLGRYHVQRGEYSQAVRFYGRALHLVRLNDGLYSEMQAPVVRELLDAIRMSGDYAALDGRYDYFFRLYGSGQPPFTRIRIAAALEYLRWQREALRLSLSGDSNRRLLALYHLNRELLESAMVSTPCCPETYWQLVQSQLRNLYLLQSRVLPPVETRGLVSSVQVHSMPGQEGELDFTQRQLEGIRRNSYRLGRQVLEDYIAGVEIGTDELSGRELDRARALLELGDWHQWNGSYTRANEAWAQAESILLARGETALLEAWFGAPVELPDNGAFWQPPDRLDGDERLALQATYDVSPRGRVSNLEVTMPGDALQGKVFRFKRDLRYTRFRPRFHNGEALATAGLSRAYEIYN